MRVIAKACSISRNTKGSLKSLQESKDLVESNIRKVNNQIDSTNRQLDSIVSKIADIDEASEITVKTERRKEYVTKEKMLREEKSLLLEEKKCVARLWWRQDPCFGGSKVSYDVA